MKCVCVTDVFAGAASSADVCKACKVVHERMCMCASTCVCVCVCDCV